MRDSRRQTFTIYTSWHALSLMIRELIKCELVFPSYAHSFAYDVPGCGILRLQRSIRVKQHLRVAIYAPVELVVSIRGLINTDLV
jgi:hypothetical protein